MIDYNIKTVSELKEVLSAHNRAIPTGAKKADLIKLVEEIMTDNTLFDELFEEEVAVETVADTEEELAPEIGSLEWNDYVMSHFQKNELIDGNPICAGLRRVAELLLGDVVESGPTEVFPATDNNGPGRATVVYQVVFNWMNSGMFKTYREVADVWHGNTDDLFCAHPVATASTRAEGRALRKALKIRCLAAEELAKKNIVEIVQQTVAVVSNDTSISQQQIQFIDTKCKQLDIGVTNFINMGEKSYSSINDVDKNCAKLMIKHLNGYQNGETDIPESITGYKNWRTN
tara:strand:+ start:1787 stop:2650 length:864 start_codon:yes stop_codon:yes gene_type:complete